jgi:hypothetical protein
MAHDGPLVEFFISHAGRDRSWAEWVAWQLVQEGHSVELAAWDWSAGDNFVLRMADVLDRCERVVELWSPAYFERQRFTNEEWAAVAARRRKLVPLRVEPVDPPSVLAPVVYRDLFGLAESAAREVLLAAIDAPTRPTEAPDFPGSSPARTR